jgi:hypothetical protein
MVNAGVILSGDGLRPSSQGARVKFSGGKPSVIDGPFAETKELIAGFSIMEVRSREEAIEWVKRWPPIDGHGEVEIEIRQILEAEDFGEEFTAEMREIEEVLLRHPGVAECSVIGRQHAEWGEEVVAFVVARHRIAPEELDSLCLDNIARFKRPREYRFVDSLPKNNYGKVLKTELRKLLGG